jgi:hypothetical protein
MLYALAEDIEGRRPRNVVLEAIWADIAISERQRRMLIDVYESFLKPGVSRDSAREPGRADSALM